MAYIPQFIQTDPRALQGTLDQYQKAYDQNTNVYNQVNDMYSMIPTNNPVDIQAKNEKLGQFSKVIDDLDKKYNYDRASSQYTQELARKITELRSDTLWSHIEKKAELDKLRTQLMAERGTDYYENFNPNNVSVKESTNLQNWKPQDLRAVKQTAAMAAKEYATSFRGSDISRPIPGIIQYTDKYGAQTTEDAINYLNSKPGQKALEKSIIAAGFDPADPIVLNAARESMLSNLVGENRISRDRDFDYFAKLEADAKRGSSLISKVSNQAPFATPYSERKLSDVESIRNELNNVDKEIVAKTNALTTATSKEAKSLIQKELSALNTQREEIQLESDRINSVIKNVYSLPENKVLITKGREVVKNVFPELSDNQVNDVEELFRDYYINTRGLEKLGNVAPKQYEIANTIYKKIYGSKIPYSLEPTSDMRAKEVLQKFNIAFDQYKDFYKEHGNYKKSGFETIEDQINTKLKEGEKSVFDVYSPTVDLTSAEYKQPLDYVRNNMRFFLPVEKEYREGKGTEWNPNKLKEAEAVMAKTNTTINYLFDHEDNVYMQLHNPGGDVVGGKKQDPMTVTLKVDINRSGTAPYEELAIKNKDLKFLDSIHSDFKIAANREYSTEDPYLRRLILNDPLFMYDSEDIKKQELENLKGIRIKKIEDPSGMKLFELYLSPEDTEPVIYYEKSKLLSALKQFAKKE